MTDSYVCPLSEKSLKKAKEELNEDPKERLSAINTFKNWILEQPHITCPTAKLQPWAGRYTTLDICRLMVMMTYDTFMSDEELQVNGVVVFDDLTGMSIKHQTMFSLDEQKTFFGGWHRSIPARIKKILIYNVGAFGEFLMSILRLTMPESLQERLVNCGSNLENVYKDIPMDLLPVEYLPDDYKGQNGGSLKELIESYRVGISSPERRERIRYLSDPKFRINEAKRPKDVASESFRKLSVD